MFTIRSYQKHQQSTAPKPNMGRGVTTGGEKTEKGGTNSGTNNNTDKDKSDASRVASPSPVYAADGRRPAIDQRSLGKPQRTVAVIQTVLGPGVHYNGTLRGAAGVRIEGTLDGKVIVNGPVIIAEGAKVNADIQATVVSVAGNVKGNIVAGKVEILSTGRVWGDLETIDFASEDGAYLRGQVKLQDYILPPSQLGTAPLNA